MQIVLITHGGFCAGQRPRTAVARLWRDKHDVERATILNDHGQAKYESAKRVTHGQVLHVFSSEHYPTRLTIRKARQRLSVVG